MSDQRVLDKLVADSRKAQSGGSSRGDGDQDRESAMGGGDHVQSVEDVLCFDRRTPLVTTALGLMGYQVPQVCDLMMKHWMDTLHALLRHGNSTAPKLRRILENVDLVLNDLKGPQLLELIEALLKAAVHMKNMSPTTSSLHSWTFVRSKCSGEGSDAAWAVEKLLEYVLKEREVIYNHLSPIARLQVWRLRPSILKADLSDLANEAMRRPLLSLRVESGSCCKTLGFMAASLALAPDLLNEARRLLLMWSSSVRAVRLLELRAQLTVAVHGILQCSNGATGSSSALSDEGVIGLHGLHSSSLGPFLQVLVGVPPTASALSHLVGLMERRESSSTRTAANTEPLEIHKCEQSPKRQRRTADQDESLDDSSSNMLDIMRADKEAAGLRTITSALSVTTSQECVYNYPIWTLLADFLPWATFASQLLFQDGDMSTGSRQTAADFLGWLMCPASLEGRAYATTEFLHAAQDWQSFYNEGITAKETQNGKESFPPTICNLCGSPVNWTGDLVNKSAPRHALNPSTLQNLVAWVSRLYRLATDLQQPRVQEGCKNVSQRQSDLDGMWRVIRVLPIAFLASDANAFTPEVGGLLLSMILLGLTSGFRQFPTKETSSSSSSPRSCCTVCEDFHCVSCCSKDRHKASEPPHRTEQIKDDARMGEDWAPFAAALFTSLDHNVWDPKVRVVRSVVAACVHHWVQLTTVMNHSHSVETVYHRGVQMLEDLGFRVAAWVDATVADNTELAQAVGDLKLQTEQFKSFL